MIRSFLKTVLFGSLLALSAQAALAANADSYLPGFRLVDGSQLNQLVDRVNGTTGGTYSGFFGVGANQVTITGAATGVAPRITAGGTASDTNIGIIIAPKGTGYVHLGGTAIGNGSVRVPTVASAVNAVTLTGAVTTAEPTITTGGANSDTNIGIVMAGQGTGAACLAGSTCANSSLTAVNTASAVTHVTVTGGTTGVAPTIAGAGETNTSLGLLGAGNGIVTLGTPAVTCSGTTTATCQGQSFTASVTGLTTAAGGTTSAAMTVTNASVTSSARRTICQVNGYGGTGIPMATTVTPGTGSVSFTITNVAASGSLNATVPVACLVF